LCKISNLSIRRRRRQQRKGGLKRGHIDTILLNEINIALLKKIYKIKNKLFKFVYNILIVYNLPPVL
jgi:hypothetical protein